MRPLGRPERHSLTSPGLAALIALRHMEAEQLGSGTIKIGTPISAHE
jgi:hypothetical protein